MKLKKIILTVMGLALVSGSSTMNMVYAMGSQKQLLINGNYPIITPFGTALVIFLQIFQQRVLQSTQRYT